MTIAEYRIRMASGEKIVGGSPLHEVFHRHSREAQQLLAEINTGYHEAGKWCWVRDGLTPLDVGD